eukprot:scaffold115968_cov19-Tisochrysis_lutea.AAC.1
MLRSLQLPRGVHILMLLLQAQNTALHALRHYHVCPHFDWMHDRVTVKLETLHGTTNDGLRVARTFSALLKVPTPPS